MEYKNCEECYKNYSMDKIVIKSTDDGNCFYCRMCYDYIKYMDIKFYEMKSLFNITDKQIMKEIKLME
jgi:hypothetical protein